jgi:hypothetical protein
MAARCSSVCPALEQQFQKNQTQHKISLKFQTQMRTWLSHSRQIWHESAASKLVCDHYLQPNAVGCVGHWNRKSEANVKTTIKLKIRNKF